MRKSALALAILRTLLGSPVRGADSLPPILDVYGTQQFSTETVEQRFGKELLRYQDLVNARPRVGPKKAKEIDAEIREITRFVEAGLLKLGNFAWARLEWTWKPAPEGRQGYVTVEIVEAKDKAARLPFRKPPGEHIQDPSGLNDAWAHYAEAGLQLARKGEVSSDRVECPAFFCRWGSATPELERYEERFIKEVPGQKETLSRVLGDDADPTCRANALYLLTYVKDGAEVSKLASRALTDPDDGVREAALRVYTDIVLHHPDVPIPLESIAAGLDYPYIDDRTRVLAFLLSLADKPTYRPFMLDVAAPQVLRLLRLRQPDNHQMAYTVLGLTSGLDLGDRDYDAWEAWLFKARTGKTQKNAASP